MPDNCGTSKLLNVGNIYNSNGQNGNIYSVDGISPTISSGATNTVGNGGIGSSNSPKVIIYDDYNCNIRADQSTIGTITSTIGHSALRNSYKLIEHYNTITTN